MNDKPLKDSYQIRIFVGEDNPVVNLIDLLEVNKNKYLVYTDNHFDENQNPIISFVKFGFDNNGKPIISTIPTKEEFDGVLLNFAEKIKEVIDNGQ